jgi:biotin carboxylase
VQLCLIASKPTDSVIHGFLPAAARLGLEVILLTDQPEQHERAHARSHHLPRPGCPRPTAEQDEDGNSPTVRFLGCDVWDARELISTIAGLPAPHAIVSNSDHLQTQTALAAAYFDLPGKDWRLAMRAKNKFLMRRRLAEAGTEHVAAAEIHPGTRQFPADLRYPVVLKPAEGVASEDVMLVISPDELAERSAEILARRPGETLLAEEYLSGQLRTLETLSDGKTTWVLGGFRTTLSPPPFFIEERLTWEAPPAEARRHVLDALDALGTPFGACHTEYVDGGRGPALIEVNDRLIGDDCDFVLSDLLGTDLFEVVLRVHLGESLPAEPPKPLGGTGHAIIDYVVADRPGALTGIPKAGRRATGEPDVLLSYRTLREQGDRITITHTNRDYLGVISAIGTNAHAVEQAVAAARATESWVITGSAS